MLQNYTPEFKKKMVRLHEERGRTYQSITAEYSVSKASISQVMLRIPQRTPNRSSSPRRV